MEYTVPPIGHETCGRSAHAALSPSTEAPDTHSVFRLEFLALDRGERGKDTRPIYKKKNVTVRRTEHSTRGKRQATQKT